MLAAGKNLEEFWHEPVMSKRSQSTEFLEFGTDRDASKIKGPVEESRYLYPTASDEFTPPASPSLESASISSKKSSGSIRPQYIAYNPRMKVETARTPSSRPRYSPFPSPVASSPPPLSRVSSPRASPPSMPQAIPPPHVPLRKRASKGLRLGTVPSSPSPLNERFASGDRPSPTYSARSDVVRQGSGSPLPDASPTMGPLSSNPVTGVWGASKEDLPWIAQPRARGQTTSSSAQPIVHPVLRSATSIPDYASFRAPNRNGPSALYKPDRGRRPMRDSGEGFQFSLRREPVLRPDDVRSSFRSGWTNASSGFLDTSGTERSSVVTKRSSISDNRSSFRQQTDEDDQYETGKEREERQFRGETAQDGAYEDDYEDAISVEDCIDLYTRGWKDDPIPEEREDAIQDEGYSSQSVLASSPESKALPDIPVEFEPLDLPVKPHRRSASLVERGSTMFLSSMLAVGDEAAVSPNSTLANKPMNQGNSTAVSSFLTPDVTTAPRKVIESSGPVPRDRYGFKKATKDVTVTEYDAWYAGYSQHVSRRSNKWEALLKKYGYATQNPTRFPPKSEIIKRFIRKGCPPAWRGAIWFYYAGGPEIVARNPGLYKGLTTRLANGELSEADRDVIERDLNRTFPDNIRFKPDESSIPRADTKSMETTSFVEPSIIRALRHVLQAFALNNPHIGYCQSLNFIAGLLLLFLDEDEEKTFIMLTIITNDHLPGTHAKILESNIDMGVLMGLIRQEMPAVYAKIDDTKLLSTGPGTTGRLPTISLSTTSWFMSLFVGTLPIETVLRVWDIFFYEGPKTLFRISLAIFKAGEMKLKGMTQEMEAFLILQSLPRKMIDPRSLIDNCYKRRGGFLQVSGNVIASRRQDMRKEHKIEAARASGRIPPPLLPAATESATSRMKRSLSRKGGRRLQA